ncbi:hypothetical protein AB3N02_04280 [Priestia aryabhattai]
MKAQLMNMFKDLPVFCIEKIVKQVKGEKSADLFLLSYTYAFVSNI